MKDVIVFSLLALSIIVGCFVAANEYSKYLCSNYQKVTGVETTFVSFDACYIKGDSGRFERYDGTLRNNN